MTANSSALLGLGNEKHTSATEEEDLKERSLKKIKGGNQRFAPSSSVPISYADIGRSTCVRE
ncbi:hypothetical protein TSUD_327550 [Trifolium subterraneum]|uniref:Uncharacterized protein n=1 Tax=Trifolium subterraneum TaxID=3900 RepID=A0A2Z6PK19_TRISU|nr:hypothetical protein TSUD_327550 [Trifolium subterraneum]